MYLGDMDSYFLNMGVRKLDEFLKQRAKDLQFSGAIVFQPMAPHCWGPRGAELFGQIVTHIDRDAPTGADLKSWKY